MCLLSHGTDHHVPSVSPFPADWEYWVTMEHTVSYNHFIINPILLHGSFKGRRTGIKRLIAPVNKGDPRTIREIAFLQPDHIVRDAFVTMAHDFHGGLHVFRRNGNILPVKFQHPLPFLVSIHAGARRDRHDIARHRCITVAVIYVGNHAQGQVASG